MRPDERLRRAETQTRVLEASAYLDAEVPSVHVVAEEQIAGGAGGSAHLEKLHQVKELAVDIAAHWTQTNTGVGDGGASCDCSLTKIGEVWWNNGGFRLRRDR